MSVIAGNVGKMDPILIIALIDRGHELKRTSEAGQPAMLEMKRSIASPTRRCLGFGEIGKKSGKEIGENTSNQFAARVR